MGQIDLNVEMAVGQTTQQVVVTAQTPLLQTTSAELSSSIAGQSLQALPQAGTPDWQSWVVLQPGTAGTPQASLGATNFSSDPEVQAASNGSMPFSEVLLDGGSVSSTVSDNVIDTPIFDAIDEVKMVNGLFSAQYGVGGMIYNQITKGGTSSYHGMAYDYFQNDALNAAAYAFGRTGVIPMLRYNDIGANLGGPLLIPHLRKRVFFFIAHEAIIDHSGTTATISTVPNAAMRAGDFTGFNTIYDPTTQVVNPVTGVVTRHHLMKRNDPQ